MFVLAIDEKQLESSVKCLFGTDNFDGYKRKFINNSFLLPTRNKVKFVDYLYQKTGMTNIIEKIKNEKRELVFKIKINKYKDYLQKTWGVGDGSGDIEEQDIFNKWQTSEQIIKKYFSAYSIWFDFTLRQMEQVFDRLVLFTKQLAASNEFFSPDLAVFLVCLHESDKITYDIFRKDCNIYNNGNTDSGALNRIQEIKRTIKYSTNQILEKNKLNKTFPQFNRNLVQQVPQMIGFSGIFNLTNADLIKDNVDRFFDTNTKEQAYKLFTEFIDKNSGENNLIDTNGILVHIISNKSNAKWEEPIPDNITNFDIKKFRASYFSQMDIISNFQSKTINKKK